MIEYSDEENNKWAVDKAYFEDRGYINGKKVNERTGETRIAHGYYAEDNVER